MFPFMFLKLCLTTSVSVLYWGFGEIIPKCSSCNSHIVSSLVVEIPSCAHPWTTWHSQVTSVYHLHICIIYIPTPQLKSLGSNTWMMKITIPIEIFFIMLSVQDLNYLGKMCRPHVTKFPPPFFHRPLLFQNYLENIKNCWGGKLWDDSYRFEPLR